jgi:ankyrin repeat protein
MTFEEAYKAIKRGDLIRLRKELEGGMSPDLANSYSWTILMAAAMYGNTQIGRLLIEKGACLDRRNKFGMTAISIAAQAGHAPFVRLLLTSGVSLDFCQDRWTLDHYLDHFLDWDNQFSAGHKERMEIIRELFDSERKLRDQSPLD